MNMKLMIVCVAMGCAAVMAAPKERKSSIQLGASSAATAYDPKIDPSSVTIDKANSAVETQFVANNLNPKASKKFRDAAATMKKEAGQVSLVGDSANLVAKKEGTDGVSAQTAKGNTATGQKVGKGQFTGQADRKSGAVNTEAKGTGNVGNVAGEGGKSIDFTQTKERVYTATGNGNKVDANANVENHSANGGNGIVAQEGKPEKAFTYEKTGDNLAASIGDAEASLGRSQKMWNCGAMKQGVSTCTDQNGRSVGEVVVDSDGKATLFKTVGNSKVKIGAGNAFKNSDGSYTVNLNNKDSDKAGLFSGSVKDFKKGSCYREVTGKRQRKEPEAEITRLDVIYNSQNLSQGATTINFPDCFDVVAEVKVSQTVKVEQLAIEFDVNVSPLGKLKCFDNEACSTGCYYCDLCSIEDRKEIGDSVCPSKGGRTFTVKTTVCPPAEDTKALQCARFDRSIISQIGNNGKTSIEAKAMLWQRGVETAKLEKKFFAAQNKGRISDVFNAGLKLGYLKENPGTKWEDVQPAQRLAYYTRKNSREQLLACQEGEMDYQLGGSKVDTDVLLNFGQAAKDAQDGELDLFSKQPCDAYTEAQAAQYAEVEAANSNNGGGILGGLSSLLNRG